MANARLNEVVARCRRSGSGDTTGSFGDRELLGRFVSERDEAAFAALVARHGPMVMGVCRRVLGNHDAAEDAFQATFLVLARKAGSLRGGDVLGNWLHGVAHRTASRARVEAAKRKAREAAAAAVREQPDPLAEMTARELLAVLDEELSRLPARYRVPLVLCYLAGRTRRETAAEVGCSPATLDRLLARGRDLLGARLVRRGLGLSVALMPLLLSQGAVTARIPHELAADLVRAAAAVAAGDTNVIIVSAKTKLMSAEVAALADEVLRPMFLNKLMGAAFLVMLLGLAGAGAGFWLGAAPAPVRKPVQEREELVRLFGTPSDPNKEAEFAFEGQKLIIRLPKPTGDRAGLTIPHTLRPVTGDFVLQVKMSYLLPEKAESGIGAAGGLLIWGDEKNHVLFHRYHDPCGLADGTKRWGTNFRIEYNRAADRPPYSTHHQNAPGGLGAPPVYLRLTREKGVVSPAYSHDGEKWTEQQIGPMEFPEKVMVGVYALQTSGTPTAVTFEQFTATPIGGDKRKE